MLTIRNSILWGDSASDWNELYLKDVSSVSVSHCNIQGGLESAYIYPESTPVAWLDGNFDADPLFVGDGDYHLSETSPCIDAGTAAGVLTDIDGDLRPQGAGFDVGADELFDTSSCWDNDGDGDYDAACGGHDCDDGNAGTYLGAVEVCDGLDNNCDGAVPSDETDADGDGYRLCDGDCDDGNALRFPSALEVCDLLDNDCNGVTDEDGSPGCTVYYEDKDDDGYGVVGNGPLCLCLPRGYHRAEVEGDCHDGNGTTFPGAYEICDGLDNDCDGVVHEDEPGCMDLIDQVDDVTWNEIYSGAGPNFAFERIVGRLANADGYSQPQMSTL